MRACYDGEIVLTSYGKSSGFCIDPIEKKPLHHFYPGTSVLSFGTAGCNLTCKFCQNWDISKSRAMETLADQAAPSQIADAAVRNGCKSVAFTYNDPVVFHEYAIDTAKACRLKGILSVAVTAGYVMPEPRTEFYQFMDAANVDLKGFSERFYARVCGGRLAPVLETLVYLKRTKVWLEITNLLIPGENDSPSEIQSMCEWIAEHLGTDVPIHFTAFHPDLKMTEVPATSAAILTKARAIANQCGLLYAYTGNIHDPAGASTYCRECGNALIIRDWFRILDWNLGHRGECRHCGQVCPGHFENKPGQWGDRRVRINIPQEYQ